VAMSPRLRRIALILHVVSSVGWLGSVVAFLALAVVGLRDEDADVVRAVYRATGLLATLVIVPLNYAALATGLVSALGTKWGLLRHWWVLMKFLLILLGTILFTLHLEPIRIVAAAAAAGPIASGDLHGVRVQIVFDAAAAIVLLLVTTTLSIFKPRGMTRYGQRKVRAERGIAA
jgi:hypothetical protein